MLTILYFTTIVKTIIRTEIFRFRFQLILRTPCIDYGYGRENEKLKIIISFSETDLSIDNMIIKIITLYKVLYVTGV